MSKRISEIDMAKGVGILYVISRHIAELTGVSVYNPGLYKVFNIYAECWMVMFLLLSGYVYRSKGGILKNYKSKLKTLGVGYCGYFLFFCITYGIRYLLIEHMDPGLFLTNCFHNFIAVPDFNIWTWSAYKNMMDYAYVPFWYLAQLFNAFLLFIPIHKYCEKRKGNSKLVAAIALLASSMVWYTINAQDVLTFTFAAGVSYFTIITNIVGFAGLLMLGSLLKDRQIFSFERFSLKSFGLSSLFVVVMFALYNGKYSMQFGNWGPYGIWSIPISTILGIALTYSVSWILHGLKQMKPIEAGLTYCGRSSLDLLLMHFGLAEIFCYVLGFWQPVYDTKYSAEYYQPWHFAVIWLLTLSVIIILLHIKKWWQRKRQDL